MHTTRLFGSLRLCRETQKTETQSLMYDSKDSKDLVCTRLWGKVLSASSRIAIYRGLICIKKPLRKTKKYASLVPFKYIIIRHPKGRKQYPQAISFSPDNTTCTCKPCQDKMRKGIGKRFDLFAKIPYKVLRKKIFVNKCTKRPIPMGKGLGSKMDLWLHGKILFTEFRWLNLMSQSAKCPTFFLTHPLCFGPNLRIFSL